MFRHELDDDEPEHVSEQVVSVVSAVDDTDPMDLPPLAESIDPDALDRLFAPDDARDRRLTFRWDEFRVTVTLDAICVERASEE